MAITIRVEEQDFSLATEYERVTASTDVGAVVTFVGKVRDMNLGDGVTGLKLEHYPGMTERVLTQLAEEAQARWQLMDITVIHRIGDLDIGDQIVLVIVTSLHRGEAFDACHFLMDLLKTKAPFWKKERTLDDERWLEARDIDHQAASEWQLKKS
ncbi:molybdopterin synthase catalytic subunit MoaE [Vibrio sp. RC27]